MASYLLRPHTTEPNRKQMRRAVPNSAKTKKHQRGGGSEETKRKRTKFSIDTKNKKTNEKSLFSITSFVCMARYSRKLLSTDETTYIPSCTDRYSACKPTATSWSIHSLFLSAHFSAGRKCTTNSEYRCGRTLALLLEEVCSTQSENEVICSIFSNNTNNNSNRM